MSGATLIDKITSSITQRAAEGIAGTANYLSEFCESPIEIALGCALIWTDRLTFQFDGLIVADCSCISGEHPCFDPKTDRLLVPQYPWRGRRIDFALFELKNTIFIECDGHDYHERTPLQAGRDRRKDREVQLDGFHILRFTGTEINQDPIGCAKQIWDFNFSLSTAWLKGDAK